MKKILVAIPVQERHKKMLEDSYTNADFIYKRSPTVEDLVDVNIIIGNIGSAKIPSANALEWIQLNTAGADAYMREDIREKGIVITNATGAYGLAISEYLLAGTLSLIKQLNQYYVNQLNHDWSELGEVSSIDGARTLIIGLGDIGSDFGRKMKALGSYVVGIKKHVIEKPIWLDEVYTTESLDDELQKADIVAMSLPNTPETANLINLDKLKLMKKSAIILNVGRGNAIVTDDLCYALNNNIIFGAYLDVTNPEPLPKSHPLWNAKNIIITPHISGQYNLPETFERVVQIACKNLKLYSQNKPLINTVDFDTGYKKQ